ncbi:GntR family transcriptional regulator, partial [Clostridioides difficile]
MPINSFENYPMTWKPKLDNRKPPIYKTLAMLLEEDIKRGNLNPGDKLPPQRELADFLDLNLSTITRAFKLCEEKGLICAKVGKGTFISSDVNVSNTLL